MLFYRSTQHRKSGEEAFDLMTATMFQLVVGTVL